MSEQLHIPRADIPAMRKTMYNRYGTTLRGLQKIYHIDEQEFVDFVHDVPLEHLLQPDPMLRQILLRYPQRKIIFTNADRNHARRVIHQVGLEGCFDGMVDILDLSPYCKPMPESFEYAMRTAGENDPGHCVFIDDSPKNLTAGREFGFLTIQVGEQKPEFDEPSHHAHHAICCLRELPEILDPLLSGKPCDQ